MDGDDALGPPERIVSVRSAERLGDVSHRLAHRVEVGRARRGRPLDIHLSVAERDASVGRVPAHPEEWERTRCQPALTDELGHLGRDRRLVPIAEAVPDHLLHHGARPLHRRRDLRGLDEPVREVREARLLHVVAASRALLVGPVGLTDGGRDDRPVRRVDDPQLTLVRRRLGIEAERDQVAVAAEAAAERLAERGQADAVAEEERGRPERSRAEEELVAGDGHRLPTALAVGLGIRPILQVANLVAAPVQRGDAVHLGERPDVCALEGGGRQVVVIQGVLRALVAADVALAAEPAREPGRPVDVAVRRLLDQLLRLGSATGARSERHRERRLDHLQPERLCRLAQRLRFRQIRVGVRRRSHHRLDRVVVTIEVVAPDGPVLVAAAGQGRVVHEPSLVLAQQDVGVDQRAAAQSRRDDRLDLAERADVEQAEQLVLRLPEGVAHLVGVAGEAARRVASPALEDDHGSPRVGQAIRGDGGAEPRSDDDRIEMLSDRRHGHPPGESWRREYRRRGAERGEARDSWRTSALPL